MKPAGRPGKPRATAEKPLSLHPLPFEDALDRLLSTPSDDCERPAGPSRKEGAETAQRAQGEVMNASGQINERLRDLVLYIASRLPEQPNKKKLHKLLYFIDFAAFRELGEPISGEEYVRKEHGPYLPALDTTIEKMSHRGETRWLAVEGSNEMLLDTPSVLVKEEAFAGEQLALIERCLESFGVKDSKKLEQISHRRFGWLAAAPDEAIPYNTGFVGNPRPLVSEEVTWALDLIGRYREWKRSKAEFCP